MIQSYFRRAFEWFKLNHVGEVLDREIKANLKLKPEKCVFAANQAKYLGFEITKEGIKPREGVIGKTCV